MGPLTVTSCTSELAYGCVFCRFNTNPTATRLSSASKCATARNPNDHRALRINSRDRIPRKATQPANTSSPSIGASTFPPSSPQQQWSKQCWRLQGTFVTFLLRPGFVDLASIDIFRLLVHVGTMVIHIVAGTILSQLFGTWIVRDESSLAWVLALRTTFTLFTLRTSTLNTLAWTRPMGSRRRERSQLGVALA